jgi:hypothetical protein
MPPATPRAVQLSQPILGRKIIEFTAHALERMEVRDVTQEDVLNTLQQPDETGLPTQPGRTRVRWNKSRRVAIDVVYELEPTFIVIITVVPMDRRILRMEARRRRR